MRTKTTKRILAETPQEIKDKVKEETAVYLSGKEYFNKNKKQWK